MKTTLILVLALVLPPLAWSGEVTHYRMDRMDLPGLARFGSSFTFSIDDANGDRIGTPDEIASFSGLACTIPSFCPFGDVTTLGIVPQDLLFGGSGSSHFSLLDQTWTYLATDATVVPGMTDPVPPYDATFPDAFAIAFDNGLGAPLQVLSIPDGAVLWTTTQIPVPGIAWLFLTGLAPLLIQRQRLWHRQTTNARRA